MIKFKKCVGKSYKVFALCVALGSVNSCSDDRKARIAPEYIQEDGMNDGQNEMSNGRTSFAPPQIMQNNMNLQQNLQQNGNAASPVDVDILASEYNSIAKLFELKNGSKQKEYFIGKAEAVTKTGIADIEVLPNDIITKNKTNEKILRISLREPIAKQKTLSGELDSRLSAKIIATYDCAVVDAIESSMSSTDMITSCYDEFISITDPFKDQNEDSIVLQNIPQPSAQLNADGTMQQTAKSASQSITVPPYQMMSVELKPFTEQVSKTFFVIEFDKSSSSLDISYYEKFKSIAEILKKYPSEYAITIVGFELYSEDPFLAVKNKKGILTKVKRSPAAIMAAKKVNEMLKIRALTVRKMLVQNGVNESNIIIAHPEQDKVKFLYNIKDVKQGENVLENLIIVDVKSKEDQKN